MTTTISVLTKGWVIVGANDLFLFITDKLVAKYEKPKQDVSENKCCTLRIPFGHAPVD